MDIPEKLSFYLNIKWRWHCSSTCFCLKCFRFHWKFSWLATFKVKMNLTIVIYFTSMIFNNLLVINICAYCFINVNFLNCFHELNSLFFLDSWDFYKTDKGLVWYLTLHMTDGLLVLLYSSVFLTNLISFNWIAYVSDL